MDAIQASRHSPIAPAAGATAPASPAADGFAAVLASAGDGDASNGALPAEEPEAAPPLPPPPPPPPAAPDADSPLLGDPNAPAGQADLGATPADETSPPENSAAAAPQPGFEGASGTVGAARLLSLGITPSLQSIVRRARRFVPPNSTLHIFSTAPGHFRGRFVPPGDGSTPAEWTGPSAPPPPSTDAVEPPPPAAEPEPAVETPLPPAPTEDIDSTLIPPPPAPPPIPPDEIAPPGSEDTSEDEAAASATTSAALRSSAGAAYRAAADGVINPLSAPARTLSIQPDERP